MSVGAAGTDRFHVAWDAVVDRLGRYAIAAGTAESDRLTALVRDPAACLLPGAGQDLGALVRGTPPGDRVVVLAPGALRDVEFVTFPLRALQAVIPGLPGPAVGFPAPGDGSAAEFDLAGPDRLRSALERAGARRVHVEPVTWTTEFTSADQLLGLVLSAAPGIFERAGPRQDGRLARARHVLDGMLRERSGGMPGAHLHARLHVAVGTA